MKSYNEKIVNNKFKAFLNYDHISILNDFKNFNIITLRYL